MRSISALKRGRSLSVFVGVATSEPSEHNVTQRAPVRSEHPEDPVAQHRFAALGDGVERAEVAGAPAAALQRISSPAGGSSRSKGWTATLALPSVVTPRKTDP